MASILLLKKLTKSFCKKIYNEKCEIARIKSIQYIILALLVQKGVDLHPRRGSCLSLTVTNPTSFGDFPKIKKQLTKLGKQ